MHRLARTVLGLVALGAAVSCSRDLSLPTPPGAAQGSLSGTVVFAQPGAPEKQPAAGARVELLGTGRTTFADAAGRFVLADLQTSANQLLIQFDPLGTGVPSRQKVIDLGAFGVQPGLQVSIGEVTVSENARLRGKVLRADAAPGAGGHAGTIVYVPQGPFTTFTNDDGSFVLENLPEGSLSVAAFRTGYQSAVVDGVSLRPGEDFTLRDLTLGLISGGGTGDPGNITGTVVLDPPGSAAGTALAAVDGAGATYTAVAAADGTFTIGPIPPGVYQLSAVRAGYGAGRVANVAVAPGQTITITELRLATDGGTACVPNAACQPAGEPCKVGTLACEGGASCVPFGNAIDGTPCGSGSACKGGACKPQCAAGRICTPANTCHVGVVVCADDGTAVCTDIGANLPDGQACGPSQSCSAGACVTCTGAGCGACSVQCVPANPCKVGSRTCEATSACTETPIDVADGTGCGTNQVCLAGACLPCSAGANCETLTNSCKVGVVSCTTGLALCVEGPDKADDTACGSGDVCRSGTCVPAGGQVQTLFAKTPVGSQSVVSVQFASSGDVYFVDTYDHTVKRIPAAGGPPVVVAGQSGLAADSADNQPATSAKLYYPAAIALDEATGLLYVSDTYNQRIRAVQLTGPNRWILNVAGGGTSTGPGFGDGGPAACLPGATGCTTLSYPTSIALGSDGGKRYLYLFDSSHGRFRRVDLAAGTIDAWSLDTNCSSPVAFQDCSGSGCGLVSAGTGGMFVSGRLCGASPGGSTFGILRVPQGGAPLVHVAGKTPGLTTEGGFSRSTAFADTPGLAVDGAGNLYTAQFGANLIRRISPLGVVKTVAGTGAASSLGDGGVATAASFNGPIAIDFNRGGPAVDAVVAEERGNVVRKVVGLGSTLVEQGALAAVGGTSQAAVIGTAPPGLLQARLTDPAGAPLVGFTLGASALPLQPSGPPAFLGQVAAATDVNGVASFSVRTAFLPGDYRFQLSYQDLFGRDVTGSPVTLTVTATEPPAGTIFTVLNEDRVLDSAGLSPSGSFGPVTHAYGPKGVVVAPDGTAYAAIYYGHRVVALTPDGQVRVVAGTGSAGFNGDGGPATSANLYYPTSIAVDDTGQRLFIADQYNQRVRAVDLGTGLIYTIAGNGTAGATGDGGAALDATVYYPSGLAQRGGKLYVADNGPRIRVIDLTAAQPTIDAVLADNSSCSGALNFRGCGNGCGLAVDPAGVLYMSAYACGTDTSNSGIYAIMKWDRITLTRLAGQPLSGSSDADGVPASKSYFGSPPGIAFGPGGRLFLADTGGNKVRFIDLSGATPTNRLWFGLGTAGYAGNYASTVGAPLAIQLNQPAGLAFAPAGHLIVTDANNNAVRLVWKAAAALP